MNFTRTPDTASENPRFELISAIELIGHYVEHAINCTPIGSRAEELLDEVRDRIHEALALALAEPQSSENAS